MNLITRAMACFVLLCSLFSSTAIAGLRGPGKYSGVVIFDRWGGCTLYSGIYVMYVSEAVKDKLREHAGEPVRIDATDVEQPQNPGDGLIRNLSYLGPAPAADETHFWVSVEELQLTSSLSSKGGERPSVTISLRNVGKWPREIRNSQLAPTLLTRKPRAPSLSIPSDGPSYALVTRQSFIIGGDGEPRLDSAGMKGGRAYRWFLTRRNGTRPVEAAFELPDTVTLKPGEAQTLTLEFDLPAGEYEFLAGYGGEVHQWKCLASNLVAFDVDKDGTARCVKAAQYSSAKTKGGRQKELEASEAPFVEYSQQNAEAIKSSVVTIAADGKTRVRITDHDPESADVDRRMTLSADELASLRLLIRSGRFFEQQDSLAPLVGGHTGVLRLRVVLDGRDHSIRFGGNENLVPLLRFIHRVERQAVMMQRLRNDQYIDLVLSALSPRLSGAEVLRPAAFVDPLKHYIGECQDLQDLASTIRALAELTSPDEFAGFLWRRIEQADAERRVWLTDVLTSHRNTAGLPESHLSALKPLFQVRLAEITARPEISNTEEWIVRRINELLKED